MRRRSWFALGSELAALTGLGLLLACPGDDGSAQPGTSGQTSSGGATTSDATTQGEGTTTSDTSADSTGDSGSSGGTGPAPLPARLGVTADWLGGTLSVIDLEALAAGVEAPESLVVRTIDLSAYAPGPLQVELAPDGITAVVSVSPGFFGGFVGNLIGVGDVAQEGTLLVVDLETETIDEIATAHVPMGLAIAPDGSRVYTANYGLDDPVGTTMSVVDLPGRSLVEDVEVGARPEQVSLSDDGSLGMLNVVSLGGVRVFSTDDPAGTLTDALAIGDDPSDVAFVPGTDYVVATNSLSPSNFVVIDVSDPAMPVEVVQGPSPTGSTYAATSIPGTSDVMVGVTDFSSVLLQRVEVAPDGMPTIVDETTRMTTSFPLGIAIDAQAGLALVALPGENALLVLDLASGEERIIAWQDMVGPTYVAVAP